MKKEKISKVIGELADRHIEDALYCEQHLFFEGWRKWQKIAVCAAFISVCLFGMTGIVFAANVEFRKMVVTFVSGFSEKEKEQIKNGHETTSLDRTDLLIEFLHDFNDNIMGNGVKAAYGENGFDYIVLEEDNNNVNIVVNCESEQLKLLINLKGEEIEEGVQAWKIASYQMVTYEEADELMKSFSGKPQISADEVGDEEIQDESKDPEKSGISASKRHGKIYHALHKEKENIITLSEEETNELKSIFEGYKNDEAGWEGQDYNYIILFDKVMYIITEDGFVIKENNNSTSAFKMKSQDLKRVMKLFERLLPYK